MDEQDVWRAADLLIKQHGEDAEFFAAGRIDEMIERDDPVGEAVWKLIRNAIRELQRQRWRTALSAVICTPHAKSHLTPYYV